LSSVDGKIETGLQHDWKIGRPGTLRARPVSGSSNFGGLAANALTAAASVPGMITTALPS
jgi:hypothetical protein